MQLIPFQSTRSVRIEQTEMDAYIFRLITEVWDKLTNHSTCMSADMQQHSTAISHEMKIRIVDNDHFLNRKGAPVVLGSHHQSFILRKRTDYGCEEALSIATFTPMSGSIL